MKAIKQCLQAKAIILLFSFFVSEKSSAQERWYIDGSVGATGGAPIDFNIRASTPFRLEKWGGGRRPMHVFVISDLTYRRQVLCEFGAERSDCLAEQTGRLANMQSMLDALDQDQVRIALLTNDPSIIDDQIEFQNANAATLTSYDRVLRVINHMKDVMGRAPDIVIADGMFSRRLRVNGNFINIDLPERVARYADYVQAIQSVLPNAEFGVTDRRFRDNLDNGNADVHVAMFNSLVSDVIAAGGVIDRVLVSWQTNLLFDKPLSGNQRSFDDLVAYIGGINKPSLKAGWLISNSDTSLTSDFEYADAVVNRIEELLQQFERDHGQRETAIKMYAYRSTGTLQQKSLEQGSVNIGERRNGTLGTFRLIDDTLNRLNYLNDKQCFVDVRITFNNERDDFDVRYREYFQPGSTIRGYAFRAYCDNVQSYPVPEADLSVQNCNAAGGREDRFVYPTNASSQCANGGAPVPSTLWAGEGIPSVRNGIGKILGQQLPGTNPISVCLKGTSRFNFTDRRVQYKDACPSGWIPDPNVFVTRPSGGVLIGVIGFTLDWNR